MTTRLWIFGVLFALGLPLACDGNDAGGVGGAVGFGGFTSAGPIDTSSLGGDGSEGLCTCTSPLHCKSRVCNDSGLCEPTRCFDGVLNGSESDVDCGGPGCAPCQRAEWCVSDGDCASGSCVCGMCVEAGADVDPGTPCEAPQGCADGIHNLDEADVDCGGPSCQPCESGQSCFEDGDCGNGSCRLLFTRPSWCGDVQACD